MKKYLLIIAILLLSNVTIFSQAQLVQSFVGSSGDNFGGSVSTAGDVNNDGYDDVIVGASKYSSSTGRAYIYYGGSSMDNIADVTMTGETTGDNFGGSVSTAGDVNNDGYDDVIVGADSYASDMGRAYIYYGGSPMDGIADVTMTGEAIDNYFGYSVSSAGDVDNNGYDDVIVGAWGYLTSTGRAYIYYGGSPMDGIADVTMTGEATDNNFGISVSSAGNVNANDYNDVIVGASMYNSSTGRAYIYYGGSPMDGSADVTMTGEAANDNFGISVSGAGDVNNNGDDDVIVGAWRHNSFTGRAYIYYGGSPMDGIADVTMDGETTFNYFGYSVSSAGDVDNNSYDDVIVGAWGYSSSVGRAYIYHGGSSMDGIADVTMTGGVDDNFGCSVSGAGDVDNDGYYDVIIGAKGNDKVYIYSDPSSVPVELTVFTATSISPAVIRLNWTTATEVNNYGFEIERASIRSKEGNNSADEWEMIGFVEGHGNSNSPNEYSFIDTDKLSGTVQYRLKQIDINGAFEYHDVVTVELNGKMEYKLAQNHPNPFNPSTQISFTIPSAGVVKLNVYNLLGEVVTELVNQNLEAGSHQYNFDASNLTSGIYFYSISVNGFTEVKKMNLIK